MKDQNIAFYCFIEDFLQTFVSKNVVHCKISDADILTTALLAARYFYGNLYSACAYMQAHQGVQMINPALPAVYIVCRSSCWPCLWL